MCCVCVCATHQERQESWLTPVELFQPWYSFALAQLILDAFHLQQEEDADDAHADRPLQIYEVGGGIGTNAVHILNYIKVARGKECFLSLHQRTDLLLLLVLLLRHPAGQPARGVSPNAVHNA